jgi:hypothetical protein
LTIAGGTATVIVPGLNVSSQIVVSLQAIAPGKTATTTVFTVTNLGLSFSVTVDGTGECDGCTYTYIVFI